MAGPMPRSESRTADARLPRRVGAGRIPSECKPLTGMAPRCSSGQHKTTERAELGLNVRSLLFATAIIALSVAAGPAAAGVSAQEAAQLKTTLTPMGAERAANKAGTIPAW